MWWVTLSLFHGNTPTGPSPSAHHVCGAGHMLQNRVLAESLGKFEKGFGVSETKEQAPYSTPRSNRALSIIIFPGKRSLHEYLSINS